MLSHLKGWAEFMLAQRGRSPSSIATHTGTLKEFAGYLKQHSRPTDPHLIRRADIDAYMRSLFYERGNLKNTTRARKLAAIKSLFSYLIYTGLLGRNPCAGIPTPKFQQKQAQKFTTEELQRLFSAPNRATPTGIRDLAILKTLYGAGLRVQELCGLNFSDLTISANCMRLLIHGKGEKERIITMRRNPTAALNKWLGIREGLTLTDSEAVFVQLKRPAPRLHTCAVQQIVTKYCQMVDIPREKASPHKLRATFATDLYDTGRDRCPRCGYPLEKVDIMEIMILMGHSDPKTTRRYIAISEKVINKTAIPDRRWKELEVAEEPKRDGREIFRPKYSV